MNKCVCCDKNTNNPKFCSRSCSAKISNLIPKRKRKIFWYCELCNQSLDRNNRWCNPCKESLSFANKTIGDLKANKKNLVWTPPIRDHARNIYFINNCVLFCKRCNYDKHIEVCHIKGITSFSDNALISEINDLSNLIGLCRNCHWELDHGLLSIEEISN